MADFGWSYPAGCNGPPDDDYPEPSKLAEDVLVLLEAAGMSQETNDKIIKLIEDEEIAKQPPDEYDPQEVG